MKFKFHNPKEIISPKSKGVKILEVIFNGGSNEDCPYSIVRMLYDNNECFGIRWNISEYEWYNQEKIDGNKVCLGLPSSRGFPTWFILPKELLSALLDEESINTITQKLIAKLN